MEQLEQEAKILELFSDSIQVKEKCINRGFGNLVSMCEQIAKSIQNGNKLMLCGNGGSAADAQHLAAELLVRLRPDNNREGIPALALAQDTSTITAYGNDYDYNLLYSHMVKTLGNKGDCLIVITTSGNSKNIISAIIAAKEKKIKVFGFLGAKGGKALEICDEVFLVPSDNTGRIQEAHITAGHALMECLEDSLLEAGYINLQRG